MVKSEKRAHDNEWQLQEAKNRLSQVVESALHEGPQTITLRGRPAAVLIAVEDYRQLVARKTPLSGFFMQSPLRGSELDLRRDDGEFRQVDL